MEEEIIKIYWIEADNILNRVPFARHFQFYFSYFSYCCTQSLMHAVAIRIVAVVSP